MWLSGSNFYQRHSAIVYIKPRNLVNRRWLGVHVEPLERGDFWLGTDLDACVVGIVVVGRAAAAARPRCEVWSLIAEFVRVGVMGVVIPL